MSEQKSDSINITVFTSSVATFRKASLNIKAICPATMDTAWVASKSERQTKLYSKNGEVRETFKCDSEIVDIGISPVTGNLWVCSEDRCFREQTTLLFLYSSMEVRFETDFIPLRFSITDSMTVVVAGDKTLRVFKTDGTQLHSTIKDETGKFAVVHPQGLAICPLTNNIAVCNKDDKGHVVVLTKCLKIQFRYYGDTKCSSHNLSAFYPIDASYDSQGRLLIASSDMKSIIMLYSNGGLLGTIHTDVVCPVTVDFHRSGILWVGFENGMVKSLKVIEKYSF